MRGVNVLTRTAASEPAGSEAASSWAIPQDEQREDTRGQSMILSYSECGLSRRCDGALGGLTDQPGQIAAGAHVEPLGHPRQRDGGRGPYFPRQRNLGGMAFRFGL